MLVYCSYTCWTPNSGQKRTMKLGLSFLPPCFLLGCFLGNKTCGNRPKIDFFEFKEKFGQFIPEFAL